MKILAVVVALALVIGPKALVVRAVDFSSSKMKEIADGFRGLVAAGTGSLSRKIYLLGNYETGEALGVQLYELMNFLANLDKQMPAEISEAVRLPFKVSGGTTVGESQSHRDFERIFKALADYLEPTLVRASSFVEPLLTPLAEKIGELDQEMNKRIAQTLESRDGQLSFYVKRVGEIWEGLQPLAEEVGKRMETLNENLKPYLDPLLKEGRKYTDALTEWVNIFVSQSKRSAF